MIRALVLLHLQSQTKKLTFTVSLPLLPLLIRMSHILVKLMMMSAMMDDDGVFLFFEVGDGIGDFQVEDKLLAVAEYANMSICHCSQA